MGLEPEQADAQDKPARQRKSHTKSRKGCGNCKLRRVKCDESRPQCRRCVNFGVECDYDADAAPALQSRGEGALVFTSIPHSLGPGLGPESPRDSLSPEHKDDPLVPMLGLRLALHESSEEYCVTQDDVDILRSFLNRTVYTVGTAQSMDTYRRELPQLCLKSSHLIHVVLGMTLMHIRYIAATGSWPGEPSQKETFHTYHGTALFSVLLAQEPVREEDKDALWACAALLGCITIAGIDAKTPEEAWPLRDDRIADLDWLRMSDGKKQVWKVVDPLRPTSVWREVMSFAGQQDPEPRSHVPELDMLFPFLTSIYDFNPLVSKPEEEQDPYHTAASILVRLLELDCNHSTIMYFLSFLGHMDPRFRALLHKKDPKALLLLAWWYGKMCQYNVWWQSRRMVLEGQSICMYLERWHSDRPEMIKLLDYPKVMTGMMRA